MHISIEEIELKIIIGEIQTEILKKLKIYSDSACGQYKIITRTYRHNFFIYGYW